jgi:hypothetical protein
MPSLSEFKQAHARIEQALAAAELLAAQPPLLTAHLKGVRGEVLQHFKAKDGFYPELAEQCTKAGDAAGAHLTRIFESNMRVQSAAVQRFFETLESVAPADLVSSFHTVVSVIRQRFNTEEKAIFPLFVRSAKSLGAP